MKILCLRGAHRNQPVFQIGQHGVHILPAGVFCLMDQVPEGFFVDLCDRFLHILHLLPNTFFDVRCCTRADLLIKCAILRCGFVHFTENSTLIGCAGDDLPGNGPKVCRFQIPQQRVSVCQLKHSPVILIGKFFIDLEPGDFFRGGIQRETVCVQRRRKLRILFLRGQHFVMPLHLTAPFLPSPQNALKSERAHAPSRQTHPAHSSAPECGAGWLSTSAGHCSNLR